MRYLSTLFICIVGFSLSSCEKDDICDETTSTTPQVVIEFYDAASPNTLKNVTNLKVVAYGVTEALLGTSGVSKIKVPLQTTADTTTWKFIADGSDNDATNDNEDVLNFTYSRETVYVSRACGYKIVYDLTNTNTNLVSPDTDNWINSITITQPSIDSENETHIKIYF